MSESENFYRNIFTSLIDAILVISADLRIIKVNQAAEEVFQRSRDSFEGAFLSELLPDRSDQGRRRARSSCARLGSGGGRGRGLLAVLSASP